MEHIGHPLVSDRKYNPLQIYTDRRWCSRLQLGMKCTASTSCACISAFDLEWIRFLHAYEIWLEDAGGTFRYV